MSAPIPADDAAIAAMEALAKAAAAGGCWDAVHEEPDPEAVLSLIARVRAETERADRLKAAANQTEWCVYQRRDCSCFARKTWDDFFAQGERIIAVSFREIDAEALAQAMSERAKIARLEAEVKKLREALAPFADVNIDALRDQSDGNYVGGPTGFMRPELRFALGDLRRAAAVLAETGGATS